MRRLPPLLALLALPAAADVVHPRQGPAVEGIVEERGDDVLVRTPSGSVVRYPRSQVERIERAPAPQEVFRTRREALGADDAEARLELARWASGKGMRRESQALYEEVLRLGPGNAEALQALGYVQEGGIWMSAEEAHRLRGDRQLGSRWLPPAEFRREWTRELMEGLRKDPRTAPQALGWGGPGPRTWTPRCSGSS